MKSSFLHYTIRLFLITLLVLPAATPMTGQDNPAINMAQYLFPEFSDCTIREKSGSVTHALGNYNTVTEKMAFRKEDVIYGLPTISQADTVTIENRHFVPVNGVFYEVINDAPVTFFIQHITRLIPPGQPVGYGGTSQVSNVDSYSFNTSRGGLYSLDIPRDYEVRYLPVYWVRLNGEMKSFISRKQLLNIFSERKKEIASFFKTNNIRLEERTDLIRLSEYCNELLRTGSRK